MALGKNSRANQVERRVLTQRFQVAVNAEMRSRVRRAGEEIKSLVPNDQVIEAWSKPQRWYQESKGNQVPPTSEQLDQTSTLQEDLYRKHPPREEIITILVQPVSIADGPTEAEEILVAVRKLRSDRAGEPLGMKAEQLEAWLRAVTREKEPETETWLVSYR